MKLSTLINSIFFPPKKKKTQIYTPIFDNNLKVRIKAYVFLNEVLHITHRLKRSVQLYKIGFGKKCSKVLRIRLRRDNIFNISTYILPSKLLGNFFYFSIYTLHYITLFSLLEAQALAPS